MAAHKKRPAGIGTRIAFTRHGAEFRPSGHCSIPQQSAGANNFRRCFDYVMGGDQSWQVRNAVLATVVRRERVSGIQKESE